MTEPSLTPTLAKRGVFIALLADLASKSAPFI